MKTRLGVRNNAQALAFRTALAVCAASIVATAQPAPTNSPPPAPGSAPTAAPGGPNAPGNEPPPLEASPMLGDQAQPPPPPPTYPTEQQPPPPEESAPPPPPEEPRPRRSAGPFARGSIRLSFLIGSGWTTTDEYLILGAGVGYYVVDGLELGLDYEAWLFGSPVLNRLSPGVRYVFHMVPVIKPYVGGFYRHTFVNGYEDLDYVGARAGLFYVPKGGGLYFGGGAVYEHLLNHCSGQYVDCDDVYPEIFVGVSF
jgi:hypothetical protein